ncbi:MAG: peptidoglycan DD-metalloendopeptidase family protein [Bacteroidales bacterium]|nr:peptidoglycan DD-metalloendopeptidase family protein [Bacteroidales bacterium]
MKKKRIKHILSDFLQRMRFKYRVSITNENTLDETWYTRLSRFSVLIFVTAFFLTTFILLTLIIFITPLRFYLPGYQDSGNRIAMIQQTMRLDSIEKEVQLRDAYLVALKENMTESTHIDTTRALDSVQLKERATKIMEKTKREEEFVRKYEETEKYNLGAVTPSTNEKMYVFFRPVSGVVASTFNPKDEEYGIKIITSPHETVKSVLEGRVICTEYTFENEWVILILHGNDYISIYKNNTRLLKHIGDYVKAGESIAITGTEENDKSSNKFFYFEIWKKGNPINPQDVITFRF